MKMRFFAVLLSLLLVAAPLGLAEVLPLRDPAGGPLRIQDARIAPAATGGSAAVRALLVNPGSQPRTLVGVQSPLTGSTSLVAYGRGADGLFTQTPLTQLEIPAKGQLVLAPGGTELRLLGLAAPLETGLETPLELEFADGVRQTIRLKITP
jgi:periplasmic copper chaperone A